MSVQNTIQLNDKMTPVLRSIMKALDATIAAMSSVDKASSKALKGAAKAAQEANRAVEQFGVQAQNSGNKGKRSQDSYTQSVRKSKDAVSQLTDKVKTLIVTYGMYQGTQALVTAGDAFISSSAQLDLMLKMNDSQKTAVELQDQIYSASQRSLGNYREMSKQVGKLGLLAGEAFGGNTDEMIAFSELLNKQFSLAGATPWEKSAASYQLTQAMASGRLQGDEFRSIIENAPMLAQTIQQYMGLTGQAFKEASKNGEITAEVIKNALFSVADETNTMFENMPLKFGELWTQIINKIDKGLEPVYVKMRQLWNNKQFQEFLTSLTNVAVGLISSIVSVLAIIVSVGETLYNNWSFVEPVLWGIATVIGAVVIPMLWAMIPPLLTAVGTWLAAAWPIILIGIIVASVIAIVKAFGVTTEQIIGFVVGVIMAAVALVWNYIYIFISHILNYFDFFGNIVIGIFEWVFNALNGGFDNFGAGVANLLGQIISWFLQLGKVVTAIVDAIFGTNWTEGLSNLQVSVTNWGKNENAMTADRNVAQKKAKELGIQRAEYSGSFKAGYNWGSGAAGKVTDMFKVGDKKFDKENFNVTSVPMSQLDGINKNTKDTADTLKGGLNLSDEDVQLLKDYARVQFTTHLTALTPKVNATFGDVRESADVNVIAKLLEKFVQDASESDLTN